MLNSDANENAYQLIFCTCPDEEVASRLASLLVEQQYAACVNIIPGLTSVYRWRGKVETDREYLLLIKTRTDYYPAVERIVREHHPYELPEVIAVTIGKGLDNYLHWIDSQLSPATDGSS